MQDMRDIPAIVNENIVIKCCNFHSFGGGTSLIIALVVHADADTYMYTDTAE